MPRRARIEYEGAFYHLLCRGDRREAIFLDDEDRQDFLATLGKVCERTGFVVHSYVLMDNHYHLLLETPAGNLVAGMKWFQGTYTARFNARHRLRGHLFAGRYKAVLVEREEPAYGRIRNCGHTNGAVFRYFAGKEGSRSGYGQPTYSPGIILTGEAPHTAEPMENICKDEPKRVGRSRAGAKRGRPANCSRNCEVDGY